MFNWVGAQLDGILSTYVLGVVSALMAGIAPIALTAMTIWFSSAPRSFSILDRSCNVYPGLYLAMASAMVTGPHNPPTPLQ